MSERTAGLLLPAFSPRREGDLGIGDTESLKQWIDLAADHGLGFVQLLPINETGADDSPYNAISSVALEPLYLAMERVPGLTVADLEATRERLPEGDRVEYGPVRRVKRELLEQAWTRWLDSDGVEPELAAFCEAEQAWLGDYCVYRWLMDRAGGTEAWDHWPEDWRTVDGARAFLEQQRRLDPEAVDGRLGFFAWVQWLCFRQWRDVRGRADLRGVKLMGDIPIGVSRCSADVFFGRDDFDLDWCGGAPPETMFKHDRFIQKWGQNWGIPLYRWDKMEREGFPWWRRRIDKLTDVFHIFRIDHVLGFYRIYAFPWRPQRNAEFLELGKKEARKRAGGVLPGWSPRPDDTEVNRAENRSDGDRRLKVVIEAAGAAEVVGEDLGCVPDYVRPHLDSLGVAGFRIPHWDSDENGEVVPGEEYPECSFATYATHDHEPLPALWADLMRQSDDPALTPKERSDAAGYLKRLGDFAGVSAVVEFDDEILWKLISALFAARSRYAAIMVNDLFGMSERINQPGTVGPQNWTFRLPWSAAECRSQPAWTRLRECIRESGR